MIFIVLFATSCLFLHYCSFGFLFSTDDYVNSVTLGHILELLTFFVEHHTYHIKNYIIGKDLLRRVLVLMKSQHKFLVLSELWLDWLICLSISARADLKNSVWFCPRIVDHNNLLYQKTQRKCVLIGIKSGFCNSIETQILHEMLMWAKRICNLIINVNKFPSFPHRIF